MQEYVSIAIGFLTVLFNIPLVLFLISRAMKKYDESEGETKRLLYNLQLSIAKLDKDHAVIEAHQEHIESKVKEIACMTDIVASLVRKIDKLEIDTNRAWEAIRELRQ